VRPRAHLARLRDRPILSTPLPHTAMPNLSMTRDDLARPPTPAPLMEQAFVALLIAIVGFRVASLLITPIGLHPDEAQYWAWSRTLEWGYFSKPPLIAWIIAATTSVFGNAEWAARLASPFLHGATAWLLFLLGKRLYGPLAGATAALAWLLAPLVWLSSMLTSTDAALLPMWALALLAIHSLMTKPSWTAAVVLGAALGIGALAKYAMLYFPLCAALAAFWLPQARAAVLSRHGLLAGGVGLLILAPNLVWNAHNDFATLSHTVANTNIVGNDDLVNMDEAGGFFIDQIGMGGLLTVTLGVLLALWATKRWRPDKADRFLLAFILPPLIVILAQSFISRAHANWAAAAYPALVLLTAAYLTAPQRRGWLYAVKGVHVAGYVLFAAAVLSPTIADSVGLSNALKRLRGWDATAAAVEARLAEQPYQTILVDHRHLFFELTYQWRDRPDLQAKLRMWVLRGVAGNHAELLAPMGPDAGSPVLTVQMSPRYGRFLAADFTEFTALPSAMIPLGGGKTREIGFGAGATFAPQPRTSALLAEIGR
jgi:4-amino-4-deoxy-L-arabinose transferase-like glycosyltransferase